MTLDARAANHWTVPVSIFLFFLYLAQRDNGKVEASKSFEQASNFQSHNVISSHNIISKI